MPNKGEEISTQMEVEEIIAITPHKKCNAILSLETENFKLIEQNIQYLLRLLNPRFFS